MPQPQRILVIQLQQLGDVLLTAPLLEDLREAYPSATIDFLTRPSSASLLEGNPFATNIVRYDAQRALGMLREIRARNYDSVFDLQSNGLSAVIAFASGAERRVGWQKGPRSLLYTQAVPRVQAAEYVVRYRQRMLEHVGIAVRPRFPRIYLSSRELSAAARVLDSLQGAAAATQKRVALVLSARAAGSIWPVARYAAVAEQLAADGLVPVVLPTIGDDALVAQFLALAPSAQRAHFGSLRAFVAGLASFDALICGSTGPSHMGLAVGTPTITLFGADDPATWNAGLETTVAVESPRSGCAACRSAASRMAPSHTCMQEISVDNVVEQARRLLARRTPSGVLQVTP